MKTFLLQLIFVASFVDPCSAVLRGQEAGDGAGGFRALGMGSKSKSEKDDGMGMGGMGMMDETMPPTSSPTSNPPTSSPPTAPPTTAAPTPPFPPRGAEIKNNAQWFDNNGVEILCSDGGHITELRDKRYYWVGNDIRIRENGNDIHMYSSRTLGSSDWIHEGSWMQSPQVSFYLGTKFLM